MIKRHLPNVLTYFRHRITNAMSGGIASKIQALKKGANGFRIKPPGVGNALGNADLLPGRRGFHLTDNTCWILGAGASYDAIGVNPSTGPRKCVPMAAQLFDMLDDEPLRSLESLSDVATEPPPRSDMRLALTLELGPTIDWIRGLCSHPSVNVASTATRCLRSVIVAIDDRIRAGQLNALLPHGGTSGFAYCAENYLWLASLSYHLPYSSIITLNYDTVLDRAFEELRAGDRFLYGDRGSQYDFWQRLLQASFSDNQEPQCPAGVYVKLHGSIELYECFNKQCGVYRRPYNRLSEFYSTLEQHIERFTSWQSLERHYGGRLEPLFNVAQPPCKECGESLVPLLLPPGLNMLPAERSYQARLYQIAEQALARADTWIILGYSVPDYDHDVIALMLKASRSGPKNTAERGIWIVAPDATEIASRLSAALHHWVGAWPGTFTRFVDVSLEQSQSGARRPSLA